MTFTHPVLFAFWAVPVAIAVWYVRAQRRRGAAVVRWTNLDALEAAALPRPRRVRQHAAAGCTVLALAVLVVAITQPYLRDRVPVYNARVVIALDTSVSMGSDDVAPTRLEAAVDAITAFANQAAPSVEIGLVTFSGAVNTRLAPSGDHGRVVAALDGLPLTEGTALGDAVAEAVAMLQTAQGPVSGSGATRPSPGSVILISDGASTAGRSDSEAVSIANRANVKLATIAYGTGGGRVEYQGQIIPTPVDSESLAQLAADTGGTTYDATTAEALSRAFGKIAKASGSQVVPREVTYRFTWAALALLTVGAALSLASTRRLP